jgi:branched-chain amino acid aminotransferase
VSVSGSLPAWLDDRLVEPEALLVSGFDAGLRSGWGVFETLRAHGPVTPAPERHLDRLARGAQRLGIPIDEARVRSALMATLAAPRDVHEVAVRITLTAGPVAGADWPPAPVGRPTLVVTLHPAPRLPLPPARAITTAARRWPADVKTTSYVASVLASREARAAGADVAVLVDGDELLETAEGNLFALIDGELVTPPADGRLLAGVTRELVLEAADTLRVPTRIAPLLRRDVARAATLFVTSSIAGLRTIVALDDLVVPGPAGLASTSEAPVVGQLRDALQRQLNPR